MYDTGNLASEEEREALFDEVQRQGYRLHKFFGYEVSGYEAPLPPSLPGGTEMSRADMKYFIQGLIVQKIENVYMWLEDIYKYDEDVSDAQLQAMEDETARQGDRVRRFFRME